MHQQRQAVCAGFICQRGQSGTGGESARLLAAKMRATTESCRDISLETTSQIGSSFKFYTFTQNL